MDCGKYQKDNRWLRNKVLVKVTEGNIYEGWFMVDYGESQKDNRLLRNRIVKKMTEGIMSEGWIVVNIRKIIGG